MESGGPWSAVCKAPRAPAQWRKQQEQRRWSGKPLCIFPLLFLSPHSHRPAPPPPAFRLCVFFNSVSHSLIFLLSSSCAVCLSAHFVVVPLLSFFLHVWGHLTRPISSPLAPPSELCLLAISYFLSASSPSSSSSSSVTRTILCVSPGWAPGPPRPLQVD